MDGLEELGLSPKQVVFELTEKYAIENYTLFGEAVRNFKEMGFSIAVDDQATMAAATPIVTTWP